MPKSERKDRGAGMSIPAGRPGRRYASGPDCEESGISAFGKNGLTLLWNSRFLLCLKKCGTDMKRFHIISIRAVYGNHGFSSLIYDSAPQFSLPDVKDRSSGKPPHFFHPALYGTCFVPNTIKTRGSNQ